MNGDLTQLYRKIGNIDGRMEGLERQVERIACAVEELTKSTIVLETKEGKCQDHEMMMELQRTNAEEMVLLKTKLGMISVIAAGIITLIVNFSLWLLKKYFIGRG